MDIAIIGLSGSGKTTVFNVLADAEADVCGYSGKEHIGEIKVPDRRFDELVGVYSPKKATAASIKFLDTLALKKGAADSRKANEISFSDDVKNADAFVHVVRAFKNELIGPHGSSIDPEGDIKNVELEFICNDLFVIERRLQRLAKDMRNAKKGDNESEKKLLERCREELLEERPLRQLYLEAQEEKTIGTFQFLSRKPVLALLNISEQDLGADKQRDLNDKFSGLIHVMVMCGKAEMEIRELPAPEQGEFIKALGIDELASEVFIQKAYAMVKLLSFFTIGKDEVKAWTITDGTNARKAAGKIHSDIERGFIRAETISFDDFEVCKFDMAKAREQGKLRLEGKDYIVKDGDIINFKFSV